MGKIIGGDYMTITFLEEVKLRGMKDKKEEIINLSPQEIKFIKSLEHCELCKENPPNNLMTFEAAFYDTEVFMEELFVLHDIPGIDLSEGPDVFKVADISPLDLPIFTTKKYSSIFSGETYEIPQLNRNPPIVFRGIVLPEKVCETTSAVHVHEITHTQLDSIKGSIEYHKHQELLSMLVETIHSLILEEDERLLRIYDCYRIYEMLDGIEYLSEESRTIEEKLEITQYLVSNLKSYNVFMNYYYGNDKMKQEIIEWIQKTFDGEITVEEFLHHFDSLEDTSYDAVKLKKYFSRKKV